MKFFGGSPPLAPLNEGNQEKWPPMTAYDPHFLCQNPIILSKWGCLQKTRPKNIHFWTNGEQFCTIEFFWIEPQIFFKISYLAQFWKFLSEFCYLISNYTYQQVINSIMGSNMAPLMVSMGGGLRPPPPWEPQNLICRGSTNLFRMLWRKNFLQKLYLVQSWINSKRKPIIFF